jgi:cobalt-zinc-cadmium efflux system membrane fusion protein
MDEQKVASAGDYRGWGRSLVLWVTLALLVGIAVGVAVNRVFDGSPPAGLETGGEDDHALELSAGVVEIPTEAQKNSGMQVVPVGRRSLPAMLQVTGVVAPVESRVAHVRPLARGIVERVSVTLGQRVRRDEPLITIDNIELGERVGDFLTESAALRQAETDLNVRRRALDRAEALIEIEGISQQELDLRRAEFQNAQAAIASQQARRARVEEQLHRFGLSDADLAALRTTEDTEDGGHRVASHNVLRAPFAGVITRYDVAPGELVDPAEELFTITDLSEVWVLADVYEKDIAQLRTDREVAISVDAYPGRVFTGRLTYVSDLINPQTRTAKVRCVVDNRDGALKLDMFARVTIPTGDGREALAVPVEAVQQIDGQAVVFERRSPTQFVRRDVITGATIGQVVEIVSGLEPGIDVVSAGSFYLKTALLRERIGDER